MNIFMSLVRWYDKIIYPPYYTASMWRWSLKLVSYTMWYRYACIYMYFVCLNSSWWWTTPKKNCVSGKPGMYVGNNIIITFLFQVLQRNCSKTIQSVSRCCNYFYDLWQLHGAFQQGLGHRVGRIYNYIHVSRLFIIPSYYHAELCIAYQKATRFGTQYTENKCDILDFQLYNGSSSQKHFILAIFGTSLVSNFKWLYLPKLQRQLIHLPSELRRIVKGRKILLII